MRIVSLVPSLTELVLDLELEKYLVGRTKFCIHPHNKIQSVPKIGGTKNVNVQAVLDLKPDLVLANKEENSKEDIEALMQSTFVHITDIPNYEKALLSILEIGKLTNRIEKSKALVDTIEDEFSELNRLSIKNNKVCYLIWNDPLMSIGKDTFINSMLDLCGLENIFHDQNRYPTTSEAEIKSKTPNFIFLSSEPFPFKETHVEMYQNLFPDSKVMLVDGEFFSWYGSRMVLAADYFKSLISVLLKL